MKFPIIAILIASLASYAQEWTRVEATHTGSTGALSGQNHAWADIDQDGDPDLFVSRTFWINQVNTASNNFVRRGDLYVFSSGSEWSPAFGDFNNDGYPDLHIAKGTTGINALLENCWPDPFHDAAIDMNYHDTEFCQPAMWADYNGDGLLDLYVTHEFPGDVHEFWKNNYPTNFEPMFPANPQVEVDEFGLADLNSHAYGSSWADIDLDGDIDAVTSACGSNNGNGVTGEFPHNKVYRNDTIHPLGTPKDGFTDITLAIGVVDNAEIIAGSDSYACTLFDYNNDGLPDLFIGDNDGNHRLWRNTTTTPGDPQFELMDLATVGLNQDVGCSNCFYGDSAVAADYDNDGFIDLYTTQNGLYRNNGDGSFSLTDHVPRTTGSFKDASFVDYDGDGDLDVFNQDDLWQNPGNSNHWISIELRGNPDRGTTRSAHHVRIQVTAGELVQTREHRYMVGTYTQHMLPTHFGLANNTNVDEIKVFWPDGTIDTYTDIAVDQQITILDHCYMPILAESETTIYQCPGQVVPLQARAASPVIGTLSPSEGIVWEILSGPDNNLDQFSSTTGTSVSFTPSSAGTYQIRATYADCDSEAVTFTLENNFDAAVPTWATEDLTYDNNADNRMDVRDFVNCIVPD